MKQSVIDRIRHLEDKNGSITPETVVQDAMDPDSPLHDEFTWDLNEAAKAHWLDQARRLIRSVKVIITTETKTVTAVAYVRDPSKPKDEQGYLSVEKVRADKEVARDVLIDEFKRAGAALQRAQKLTIAFDIEEEVDAMAKGVYKLRRDVEEHVLHS